MAKSMAALEDSSPCGLWAAVPLGSILRNGPVGWKMHGACAVVRRSADFVCSDQKADRKTRGVWAWISAMPIKQQWTVFIWNGLTQWLRQ